MQRNIGLKLFTVATTMAVTLSTWATLPLHAIADDAATDGAAEDSGAADDTTAEADQLEGQVARYVRMLGADTLKVREESEKKLLELGPSILPYLPVPNPRMSNELRSRLQRTIDQLQGQQAAAATAGSTVTLNVDKVKLSDVLKTLEEQSGNAFVDHRGEMGQDVTDPAITLAVKDMPFFEAVDLVLEQAGLTVFPYATGDDGFPLRKIALVDQNTPSMWRRKYVSYDGAFRFEAVDLQATRGLRDNDESKLTLEIDAAWEPRLSPISASIDFSGVVAELGEGQDPLAVLRGGKQSLDMYGTSVRFPITLQLPSRDVTEIKQIRGKISALLPGRIETFRFEKLTNLGDDGLSKKQGDVTVFVENVRKNRDVWEVRLRAKFENDAGAFESHLAGWVANNELYLVSAKDPEKKIEYDADEDSDAVASTGAGFMFVLDDGDHISNYHLVYKTPAALVSREVKFEIKNLPLP